MTLRKNPLFWDQNNVILNEVNIAIIPDELTNLALFEEHQIHFLGHPLILIPHDAHLELKEKNLLQCFHYPRSSWYLIHVEEDLMKNVHLRKALSLAINRPEIVENILHANETPSMSIVPKTMQLRKKSYYPYFDPKQANEQLDIALEELGFTRKTLPKLKISGAHKHLLMAEIIQNQWKTHLGIDSEIDICEWNVFLEKVGKKDYQIAAMGWISWFNDPVYNLEFAKYRKDSINWTGWENPKYIELLDQSDTEISPQKRRKILKKAENLILEEMPIIPLFHDTGTYLCQDRVKNLSFTPLGRPIFTYVYLEP